MRSEWILALSCAALVSATSTHAATTTYQGGGWYSGGSWSGGTVPTLADDVIIPNGHFITLNSTTANAVANTITLQGSATIQIQDDSLEVDGGGNGGSSINTSDAITLTDTNAELKLSGTQTWGGAGSISMQHAGAEISVSSGATWTVQFAKISGEGTITGAGTLNLGNSADVVANASHSTLTLSGSLSLDDSSNLNEWYATDEGTLVFNHAATTLVGTIRGSDGGDLVINANITTTGIFRFFHCNVMGCATVMHDVTFTYGDYISDECKGIGPCCFNPGSGSGPYTISGPSGSGTTAICCDDCDF